MAVPVKIILYAPDHETADRAAEAAFKRFEELNGVMSDYHAESEVRKLGSLSGLGEWVPVSDDLHRVLERAEEIGEASDGAFDVTISPVIRLWRRARRVKVLPSREILDDAMTRVGPELIEIDHDRQAVLLKKADMRIDLGGIAKGDAIDQAMVTMREFGIESMLVDAGGDVGLGDPPPGRDGWIVAIAALERREKPVEYMSLSNCAVATSGDTWQYVRIDGKRYSHLVDPRTGMGLTDHSSVTIMAPDAITADALASAVSVMGPEAGIQLIEKMEGTAARIVRSPEDEKLLYRSGRWPMDRILDEAVVHEILGNKSPRDDETADGAQCPSAPVPHN